MRAIQVLRVSLGVIDVIEGATTVLRGAVTPKLGEAALVPELHGEADYGAALLLEKGCDGGRVDTSGHGYGDEAAPGLRALGQSVELDGGIHADSIISGLVSICLHRDVRGAACCALTKSGTTRSVCVMSEPWPPCDKLERARGAGRRRRGQRSTRNRCRRAWCGDRG